MEFKITASPNQYAPTESNITMERKEYHEKEITGNHKEEPAHVGYISTWMNHNHNSKIIYYQHNCN